MRISFKKSIQVYKLTEAVNAEAVESSGPASTANESRWSLSDESGCFLTIDNDNCQTTRMHPQTISTVNMTTCGWNILLCYLYTKHFEWKYWPFYEKLCTSSIVVFDSLQCCTFEGGQNDPSRVMMLVHCNWPVWCGFSVHSNMWALVDYSA